MAGVQAKIKFRAKKFVKLLPLFPWWAEENWTTVTEVLIAQMWAVLPLLPLLPLLW
jgi:hypothetical protein